MGWVVVVALASPESHSWMVTILRGGRCRWVRRAFFRWWKSPSVRVYLRPARLPVTLGELGPSAHAPASSLAPPSPCPPGVGDSQALAGASSAPQAQRRAAR